MLDNSITPPKFDTVKDVIRRANFRKWAWLSFVIALTIYLPYTLVTEALSNTYSNDISATAAAWLILAGVFVAIVYEPRYGIYAIIFFALMSDQNVSWWLPFTKNFSSAESLLYFHDSFSFSPQELCIALTLFVWVARMLISRDYKFNMTGLFWPVMIFTFFIVTGLVYGVGTGGTINIALWESRAIFYLTAMFLLCSNLMTERGHYNVVMWLIMLALFIEGIIGIWYTIIWEQWDVSQIEDLLEHSAAQHMNTLYIFTIVAWLYPQISYRKKLILPIFCIPVLVTYIISQRRAAFLTMGVALLVIIFMMYHHRRILFWYIMPPLAVIGIVYLAVFWNSTSGLAFPAQAIKSVIAEDDSNAADRASNEYRDVENLNSEFTINARPLTGVGFGQKFYIVYQMPDISFFVWWEYITHNSIIWIWMKSGVFGFISLIYMVGMAILIGARATWRMPPGDLQAIALTLTLYIMMHFIFAYVDMSWSDQSMLYLGLSMGILSSMESVVGRPLPKVNKRWPWQPEVETQGILKPIPAKGS